MSFDSDTCSLSRCLPFKCYVFPVALWRLSSVCATVERQIFNNQQGGLVKFFFTGTDLERVVCGACTKVGTTIIIWVGFVEFWGNNMLLASH